MLWAYSQPMFYAKIYKLKQLPKENLKRSVDLDLDPHRVAFGMSAVMLRDAAGHCILTSSALRSNIVKKSEEQKNMRTYEIAR